MQTKLITTILSILLIISVALNIYEYNNINTLKSQCTTLQADIDSLNNEITSLNDTISANEDEITALSSEKAELEGTIEGYAAPADQDQSDTTSDETTGVDSTSTNIELDEDEYQGDDEEETTDSTEITRTSGYRTDEEVLDYYKKQYEAGEIDKDTYDWIVEVYSEPSEAIEEIKNAMNSSSSSSEPDVIMPEGAMQGTPDQTDESNFIQWGTGDYTGGEGAHIQ